MIILKAVVGKYRGVFRMKKWYALSLIMVLLLAGCAKSRPVKTTSAALDGNTVAAMWYRSLGSGRAQFTGYCGDWFGHYGQSTKRAILVVSKYQGAPIYYQIPVDFGSKKVLEKIESDSPDDFPALKVTVKKVGGALVVEDWSYQKTGKMPEFLAGDQPPTWGAPPAVFPDGRDVGGTVSLKDFKAYAWNEGGPNMYSTYLTGRFDNVSVLIILDIRCKKLPKELGDPDHYKFNDVTVSNGEFVNGK